MQLPRLVAILSLLVGGRALATPVQLTFTPATRQLAFDRTPFDVPGPTQRITATNSGGPVGHREISLSGPFVFVNQGGGLGTNETEFWEVACQPTEADPSANTGGLEIDVCGSSCEDEWIEFFTFFCTPGLIDADPTFVELFAYAFETAYQPVAFTNPGPAPITVTGLASHDPQFSLTLASGSLPITLAPGDRLELLGGFTGGPPADVFTNVDVLAGTSIVGRTQLLGETISQIDLAASSFEVPLGSAFALPITVRNSFSSPRTITSLTPSHAGDTVLGLVGTTLAPGERARGLLVISATELGPENRRVSVAFDTGQGDTRPFGTSVQPATYTVTADDATPGDGTIDFGTRKAGSPPVDRTLTFTNLTATAQAMTCDAPIAPFELVGACPDVLPASGSVALTVRFTPTTPGPSIYSTSIGTADFHHQTGFLTAQTVAFQLALDDSARVFPDTMVPATASLTVPITNLADNAITVPLHVTGAAFATPAAEVTLAGGAHADVTVTFQPTAAGSFTGALELGTAGDLDHHTIALTGTATAAPPIDAGVDAPVPDAAPAIDAAAPGVDAGTGSGGGGEQGGGGGCSAGGSTGPFGLLAVLALVRRRRR